VPTQKGNGTVVHAQTFPDTVTQNETAVEHGNRCLFARNQRSVDIDEYRFVAVIGGIGMSTVCHYGLLLQ